MTKFIFINSASACRICYGTGYVEQSNGGTRECTACKGKGIL